MGCDGGTIPTRDELVKTKKRPEQVNSNNIEIIKEYSLINFFVPCAEIRKIATATVCSTGSIVTWVRNPWGNPWSHVSWEGFTISKRSSRNSWRKTRQTWNTSRESKMSKNYNWQTILDSRERNPRSETIMLIGRWRHGFVPSLQLRWMESLSKISENRSWKLRFVFMYFLLQICDGLVKR